jgi:hypothetical protein
VWLAPSLSLLSPSLPSRIVQSPSLPVRARRCREDRLKMGGRTGGSLPYSSSTAVGRKCASSSPMLLRLGRTLVGRLDTRAF